MSFDKEASNPHNVAGIFFADDTVIWATAYAAPDGPTYPSMVFDLSPDLLKIDPNTSEYYRAKRFSSSEPEEDIKAAVAAIIEHIGEDNLGELKVVTTASVGPFRDSAFDSGKRLEGESSKSKRNKFEGDDRISNTCRAAKWRGVKIKHFVSKEFDHKVKVNCLTDAEAMVLGEHYFYRQGKLDSLNKASLNYNAEKEAMLRSFGKDTVAYLLLDQGIGGAIVKTNEFRRGEMSLELGHLPIYPYPGYEHVYPIDSCGLHFSACLEGTISLPILEERWDLPLKRLKSLPQNSIELKVLAWYIAQVLYQLVLTHSPSVFVLGGNIMQNKFLLGHIRMAFNRLRSYDVGGEIFPHYEWQDKVIDGLDEFIKPWTQPDAGVLGCLCWSFRRIERHDNTVPFPARRETL